MEDLFKNSGCQDEGQNPIMNALSAFMLSDPSQHMRHNFEAQDMMHNIWEEAEAEAIHNQPFESCWEEGQNHPMPSDNLSEEDIWASLAEQNYFNSAWNEKNPDLLEEFENDDMYNEDVNDFMKQWNEESKVYNFEKNNKYENFENCYELALEKEKNGETDEAILLLEIEVQRNPEHSEAWGLLGKLHAYNDDDGRAICAMLKGLEIDPYNLDLLMSLGISCTNEFDQTQALNFLKTWIQNHPLYAEIPVDQANFKEDILEAFKVAVSINNQDPDTYQALGVLYYMTNNFELAEESFRAALFLKPNDAALWNRLGASLAKQSKSPEAFQCYHKALEIKPDFVRTWSNLGLAYEHIKDHESAARFYLCALSLNPKASHIYNCLTSIFIGMERYDLLEKLQSKDPSVFSNEFSIITRSQLPKSSDWEKEFN